MKAQRKLNPLHRQKYRFQLGRETGDTIESGDTIGRDGDTFEDFGRMNSKIRLNMIF